MTTPHRLLLFCSALASLPAACARVHFQLPNHVPKSFDNAVCSRLLSREASAIIENDILHDVEHEKLTEYVSTKCPFNVSRDIYATEENWKIEVSAGHWKCTQCDRVFRTEFYVDYHLHTWHMSPERQSCMDNRDSCGHVCLADLCGVLGCPSLSQNLIDVDEDIGQSWEIFAQELDRETGEDAVYYEQNDGSFTKTPNETNENAVVAALKPHRAFRSQAHSHDALHDKSAIHHTKISGELTPAQEMFQKKCSILFDHCFVNVDVPQGGGGATPGSLRSSGDHYTQVKNAIEHMKSNLKKEFCSESVVVNKPLKADGQMTDAPASTAIAVARSRKAKPATSWWPLSHWSMSAQIILYVTTFAVVLICIIYFVEMREAGLDEDDALDARMMERYMSSSRNGHSTSVSGKSTTGLRSRARPSTIVGRLTPGLRARQPGRLTAEYLSSDESEDDDSPEPEDAALNYVLGQSKPEFRRQHATSLQR